MERKWTRIDSRGRHYVAVRYHYSPSNIAIFRARESVAPTLISVLERCSLSEYVRGDVSARYLFGIILTTRRIFA